MSQIKAKKVVAPSGFVGHVDLFTRDEIAGWARYSDSVEPAAVSVRVAGVEKIRLLADGFREDLKSERPDGKFAFHCAFPAELSALLAQSNPSDVEVVDADSGSIFLGGIRLNLKRPRAPSVPDSKYVSRPDAGALWIDKADWFDKLAAKHRRGELSDEMCADILRFARDGYIVFRQAVDAETVAEVNRDIDLCWQEDRRGLFIETFEPDSRLKVIPPDRRYRDGVTKMLDLHAHSAAARRAISNAKSCQFLGALFEEAPKAFQSLNFWRGSGQPMHKDSAYVKVDQGPSKFAASWIALEDITEGSGELEYFVGSHRAPPFLFGGKEKWMEAFPEEHDDFLQSLHADSLAYDQPRKSFLAKAGDVLIWHADLAHGGSTVTDFSVTRKSLVTHFSAQGAAPFYYRSERNKELTEYGCTFCSQYSDIQA